MQAGLKQAVVRMCCVVVGDEVYCALDRSDDVQCSVTIGMKAVLRLERCSMIGKAGRLW